MPQSPHSIETLLDRVVKRSEHRLKHDAAQLLVRHSRFEAFVQDNFVIAVLTVTMPARYGGMQHTFPGVAKREPGDVYDFVVGRNIALRRALKCAQTFMEFFLEDPAIDSPVRSTPGGLREMSGARMTLDMF